MSKTETVKAVAAGKARVGEGLLEKTIVQAETTNIPVRNHHLWVKPESSNC